MSTTTHDTAQAERRDVVLGRDVVTRRLPRILLAIGRIVIGFYFLWAFLDKAFGLRYATLPQGRWEVFGGTGKPAQDYLGRLEGGPFDSFFQSTFGNAFGDWFFMISLLLIGIAFLAGAGLRLAGVGGALLMLFMYVVALPQPSAMVDGEFVRGATNPILDAHWMDALLLLICAFTLSGDTLGLGKWWARLPFVRANPWLR